MKTPWPFQHLGLKLLSVVLAILLWFAVAGDQTVERALRVPLELEQFPAGLELQVSPPSFVDVRVRGASGALARVEATSVIASLDLRGVQPGRRLFQLSPEQIRAPFDVDVMSVTPATLALVFERTLSKRVPVMAAVDGEPGQGFEVREVRVTPQTVEIEGPESAVERVASVSTETVSLQGATAAVAERVGLGVSEANVRMRQAQVDVQVVVVAREDGPRSDRPSKAEK